MMELQQLIRKVAPTKATVLLLGESGTGKTLVARIIHELGSRPTGPFIKVNCAALPDNLLESELFGYEKGAFTGASESKVGRVEEAEGGSIFLDEIGELSLSLQAKLLRFLQDREFEGWGARKPVRWMFEDNSSHQQGSCRRRSRRSLQGRPLLSIECFSHASAAASGTERGHSIASLLLLRTGCSRIWTRAPFYSPGSRGSHQIFLAGKCPGDGKLDRASGNHIRRGYDRSFGPITVPRAWRQRRGDPGPEAAWFTPRTRKTRGAGLAGTQQLGSITRSPGTGHNSETDRLQNQEVRSGRLC